MKTLELNNYGVLEMNAVEMMEKNGGSGDRPFGKGDGPAPCQTNQSSKKDGVLEALITIFAALVSLG